MAYIVLLVFGVAVATQPSLPGVIALSFLALLVTLLRGVCDQASTSVPAVITRRTDSTLYLRHSDPTAPGRPRPRAPDAA